MISVFTYCITLTMIVTITPDKWYRMEEFYQCFTEEQKCENMLKQNIKEFKKLQTSTATQPYCKKIRIRDIEQESNKKEIAWYKFW